MPKCNQLPKCNQCDSMTINGVYCHEKGCPNTDKVYVDGEWVHEETYDEEEL